MNISRRNLLSLSLTALSSGLITPDAFAASGIISAPDALAAVEKGEIILVDIRTRGEWKQTGLAAPALAISMHEAGFIRKLVTALGGDRNKPVAIICATGGRTAHMSGILKTAGFGNVLDVSEGMMGSRVGPGWLRRGLPIKSWKPE